jgi:hypothetical protein
VFVQESGNDFGHFHFFSAPGGMGFNLVKVHHPPVMGKNAYRRDDLDKIRICDCFLYLVFDSLIYS